MIHQISHWWYQYFALKLLKISVFLCVFRSERHSVAIELVTQKCHIDLKINWKRLHWFATIVTSSLALKFGLLFSSSQQIQCEETLRKKNFEKGYQIKNWNEHTIEVMMPANAFASVIYLPNKLSGSIQMITWSSKITGKNINFPLSQASCWFFILILYARKL